jgi:hypothetical protein
MTQDVNQFLMGGGGRSFKFAQHGDSVAGYITSTELRQQTSMDGDLLTWDDGKPRMQLVVTLDTGLGEDGDDDGLRRIFVRGQMTKAVQAAVVKAGERGIALDGHLTVTYESDAKPERKGISGAKQYSAAYSPPVTRIPDDDPGPEPY